MTPRAAARVASLVCVLLGCAGPQVDGGQSAETTSDASPYAYAAAQSGAGALSGHTRPVTARELAAIDGLMHAAERVRGLRFARAVPVLVQDTHAITAYVDSQIEAEELERARVVYTALGLLDRQLDVRSLLLRLMGEQIVGYYDVDRHHLVVRDDVMRAFGGSRKQVVDVAEARVVLVHELVHALQDQHLRLSAIMDEQRDSDADNAFRAMVEGDATLAMIAFAMQRESVPLSELTSNPARVRNLSELVRASPLAGTELGSAPAIVRVPLLSAYVDGLAFAANLHGDGGWGRVNRAHADPPASSEQVLHPERFVRRDAPERPRLAGAQSALGEDYELVHEDSLGELELSVYFGQASGDRAARRAANGWGGDRLYAYRGASEDAAIVWLTTWDDEREAVQAHDAAQRVVSAAPARERAQHFVARSGRAVLILRHTPPELHADVHARFVSWASSDGAGAGASTGATRPAD
jgi:hypothetical protein